jgi:uncharacterized protein YjdB
MRSFQRALTLLPLFLLALACHKDATGPVERTTLFVTPSALTLSVGDSLPPSVVAVQRQHPDGEVSPAGSVSWSSSDASVVAVSANNSLVARGTGFVVLTARSGSATAYLSITVQERQSAFYLTPASVTLVPAGTATITPQLFAGGAPTIPTGVVYTSTDESVATVTAAGVVTAHQLGTATIIARHGAQVATIAITVQAVGVHGVSVSPGASSVPLGGSTTLSATTTDADGNLLPDRFVSWSSSNPSVAAVSNGGVVTANGVGFAQITATSEGRSAVATIEVPPLPTASLVLTPGTASVPKLETLTVTARATNSGGVSVDNPAGTAFASSDESIAVVDANGVVSALSEGPVTISATFDGHTATAAITVAPARVAEVRIAPVGATIPRLDTAAFVATAYDIRGGALPGRAVTWHSTSNTVASVSPAGEVAGNGLGTAIVQATIDGVSTGVFVNVTDARTVGLTISPVSANIQEGHTRRFTATPLDKNGNFIPERVVVFRSSNPTAMPVDAHGLAFVADARPAPPT